MANNTYDLLEIITDLLVTKNEGIPMMVKSPSELKDKTVGLYFSAHWCPPCKAFTPKLMKVYEELKKKDKDFEIIFVSSDKSQSQFDEYFAEMPWTAVPFSSSPTRTKLSTMFGVSGIPALVIISPEGKLISNNARGAVLKGGAAAFPWEGITNESSGGFKQIMKFVLQVIGCYLLMQFCKMTGAKWMRGQNAAL